MNAQRNRPSTSVASPVVRHAALFAIAAASLGAGACRRAELTPADTMDAAVAPPADSTAQPTAGMAAGAPGGAMSNAPTGTAAGAQTNVNPADSTGAIPAAGSGRGAGERRADSARAGTRNSSARAATPGAPPAKPAQSTPDRAGVRP